MVHFTSPTQNKVGFVLFFKTSRWDLLFYIVLNKIVDCIHLWSILPHHTGLPKLSPNSSWEAITIMAFSMTHRQLSSRHWTLTVTWELLSYLTSTDTASLKSGRSIFLINSPRSAGNPVGCFFLKCHNLLPLNCSFIVCQNSIKNWKRTIKLQNWALWNMKFHNFNTTALTKCHCLSTAPAYPLR